MLVVLATFILDFILGFLAEVNYGRYTVPYFQNGQYFGCVNRQLAIILITISSQQKKIFQLNTTSCCCDVIVVPPQAGCDWPSPQGNTDREECHHNGAAISSHDPGRQKYRVPEQAPVSEGWIRSGPVLHN